MHNGMHIKWKWEGCWHLSAPPPRRPHPHTGRGELRLLPPTQLGRWLGASSVGNSRVLPGNPGGWAVLQGHPPQPRTCCWVTGRHGACDSLGREDRAKPAALLCLVPKILPRRRLGGSVWVEGGGGVSDFTHARGLPQMPRRLPGLLIPKQGLEGHSGRQAAASPRRPHCPRSRRRCF